MNTCHSKMKLTFEKDWNNFFNFLDVKVIREDKVFTTSVYRKPSFSGVYTQFDSYTPLNYKFSVVILLFFAVLPYILTCLNYIQKLVKLKIFL